MTQRNWRGIFLTAVFLLCVFSLAIVKTADYDAWIHLTFGRLIWTLKGFPSSEPFLFTMAGKPFWYSSWLFGVIYYGAYNLFDTYGVILLKAGTICLLFAILLRNSIIPFGKRNLSFLILIVFAVLIRHRFVERPDTFLMVFLAFSCLALNVYLFEDRKKYLYWLPFIHLLWANSHSSINLMFVPFLSVFAAGVTGNILHRMGVTVRPQLTIRHYKVISLVLAASLAMALINPYGFGQFTVASKFLNVDVFKQEILELRPPSWASLPWFYIVVCMIPISFIAAWRKFSLVDLFLILPLIYLGFLSHRFTFIFAIVAAPILARNFSIIYDEFHDFILKKNLFRTVLLPTAFANIATPILLIGITTSTIAQLGPLSVFGMNAGFGFDLSKTPENALAYMDKQGVTGRIINPLAWGQYIEWRDFPKRIPFQDGRGYLPDEILEQAINMNDPNYMAIRYDSEAIITRYPELVPSSIDRYEKDIALSHPAWALVYWDDTTLLYLRRGGRYDSIISRDEYRIAKPANSPDGIQFIVGKSALRSQVEEELLRNARETGSNTSYLHLGYLYLAIGDNNRAINAFNKIGHGQNAIFGLAMAYEFLGDSKKAIELYRQSLKLGATDQVEYRLGALLHKNGNLSEASDHLAKAIKLNQNLAMAYPDTISVLRKLGDTKRADELEVKYRKMMSHSVAEQYFNSGVNAYINKRFSEAASMFEMAIASTPTHTLSYVNLGFALFDMGEKEKAYAAMRKALELDPKCALANFGMGMIYKDRGDNAAARPYWQRYLEIEPTGYYSRKVKNELQ